MARRTRRVREQIISEPQSGRGGGYSGGHSGYSGGHSTAYGGGQPHSGRGGTQSGRGGGYGGGGQPQSGRGGGFDPGMDLLPFFQACEECGLPPDLSKGLTEVYAAELIRSVMEGHSGGES